MAISRQKLLPSEVMLVVFIVIAVIVMIAIDWLIVMGINPRKWKGGNKDDRSSESGQ